MPTSSGRAVKYWMDKEKILLENVLVILGNYIHLGTSILINVIRVRWIVKVGGK